MDICVSISKGFHTAGMTLAFFCITEAIRASGHQPTAGTAAIYLIMCSCVMRAREKTEGSDGFYKKSSVKYFILL